MSIKESLAQVLNGNDLDSGMMMGAMEQIMTGEVAPVPLAAFLAALRVKGESVAEVSAAATVMRKHATFIDAGVGTVVDTCGTGGDGMNTFNISTTSAFVTAGAGISVAKHGNRAVSSLCGSADVLEALGVNVSVDSFVMEQCIQDHGIGFLFAPCMHPAMKHVMPVRRELGVRTVFNMLGPLTNPAGATGQVLGVFSPELTEMFAEVLNTLGTRRAFVVHGEDGLDEITCTGTTRVSELRDGQVKTYEISADMYLGETFEPEGLVGGDAATNAGILRGILDGSLQGAPRAAVLLNAAAAIVAGEKADSLDEGLGLAKESIDSGAALEKLEILIRETAEA